MKKAVVLAGLLAAMAIGAQANGLAFSSVTVSGATNENGSNVTVTATITGFTGAAQVMFNVLSTNGMVGQVFPPDIIVAAGGSATWTNTSWNPYFTGEFLMHIRVIALSGGEQVYPTNVIVARKFGGTMNSVQVPVDTNAAYDANGVWTNIDTSFGGVKLQSVGVLATNDAVSIPCNLINDWDTVVVTNGMTEEQIDILYTDTGMYRPAGTPFRFDMSLHARPTGIMGFGEIKRFVWTPVAAAATNGPGRLVVDVASCSPWRNDYTTNMQASVGCAPLFMTDPDVVAAMQGMILCTSAHYMDVEPEISDIGDGHAGIGLKVNGHSNTTSYLKAFIPDTLLATWGIPVDQATNLLSGYVTHFTSNNVSKGDTATVTTEFTRIAGGHTNYAYYSTNGDAGYEARLTFTFQSPVAAQIGTIASHVHVLNDYDGDGKSDLAYYRNGYWSIYAMAGDLICYEAGLWGGANAIPVPGDFDGDGKSDLAYYRNGYWSIYLMSGSVFCYESGPWGEANAIPVPGDYDGDGKTDLAYYRNGYWSIYTMAGDLICYEAGLWGGANAIPVPGDYDGDGKSDLAYYRNGYWSIYLMSGSVFCYEAGPWGGADAIPVPGDFDGDGKSDLAYYRAGYWSIYLMAGSVLYDNAGLWGGPGCIPVK